MILSRVLCIAEAKENVTMYNTKQGKVFRLQDERHKNLVLRRYHQHSACKRKLQVERLRASLAKNWSELGRVCDVKWNRSDCKQKKNGKQRKWVRTVVRE
jgi:hypothetical protein